VVNHVALHRWDIDHVLIGPAGVIAVETKWSSDGWQLDPPEDRVKRALDQVRGNARTLRLWEGLKSCGVSEVASVVFLWGHGQQRGRASRDRPLIIDGVAVVTGTKEAATWRQSLTDRPVVATSTIVEQRWRAIDDHVRKRDARDHLTSTPTPNLQEIYWQFFGTLLAGLTSFSAACLALGLQPRWLWFIAVAVLAAVGVIARRNHYLRLPALAWLTGLATGATVISGVLLIATTQ